MIKFDLLLKRMWTVLAVLFCTVVSAQAAAITYQLTTHVDGRTITASTDLTTGATLEDNMPQKLWRGYTTYKYYSDAELTQEIATLPEGVTTVYVDYEFNPPFAMSEEGGATVYYTLRGNYANGNDYYFYGTGSEVNAIINDYSKLRDPDQGKWAYYGDGYSLNFLNKATDTWLGYNNQKTKPVLISDQLEKGWQLFETDWEKNGIEYFMLLIPEANDEISVTSNILGLNDMSASTAIMHPGGHGQQAIDGKCHWDKHATLIHDHEKISWGVFYGTISEEAENIWHVEYRIFNGAGELLDQKFYDKEKEAKPVDYYYDAADPAYDEYGYYHDAEFSKTWDPADANDLIPATGTTIVYVKKVKLFQRTFTEGKWMTLVLPDYNLLPQNGINGRFLDYVAVESKENATDGYHWDCDLKFEEVGPNDLVPNRPYLYLPTHIEGTDDNVRSKVIKFPLEGTPLTVSHVDANQPDVTVTMYGTYEDFELVPCEPVEPKGYKYIYFYFGNPEEDVYNFYTVESPVTIAPTICYFDIKATKNANPTIGGFGAKFSFFDGTNAISNIEGVKKNNDKIYNLNGQQVQGNLQKGIYIVNGKKVLVK